MPDSRASAVVVRLEELGRSLEIDDVDLVDPVCARIGPDANVHLPSSTRWSGARRPAFAVAAVILLALVLVLALPGPRDAVARFFGIRGVRITSEGEIPAGIGRELDLGAPISIPDARDRAPGRPTRPEGLGPPTAAFADRPPGALTLVWAPTASLPEVHDTGVGLIVTSFPGQTRRDLVEKRILPETTVEQTTIRSSPAFWISGVPHAFVYLDADGKAQLDTTRLAANTLLWEDDGITYRLESALERADAIALAESLESLD
jgi:hypothetical protein